MKLKINPPITAACKKGVFSGFLRKLVSQSKACLFLKRFVLKHHYYQTLCKIKTNKKAAIPFKIAAFSINKHEILFFDEHIRVVFSTLIVHFNCSSKMCVITF